MLHSCGGRSFIRVVGQAVPFAWDTLGTVLPRAGTERVATLLVLLSLGSLHSALCVCGLFCLWRALPSQKQSWGWDATLQTGVAPDSREQGSCLKPRKSHTSIADGALGLRMGQTESSVRLTAEAVSCTLFWLEGPWVIARRLVETLNFCSSPGFLSLCLDKNKLDL